jgi:vacuolar protein sorting-associated protein VTA1
MPLAIPDELKKIQPVVRRAEELDRDKVNPESRIVAYYCRQYAVHTGIPLAGSSAGAKTCLGHLLEQLEGEKEAMSQFTREEAAFLCRKFATDIFDKADFEDREGKANKNTAKTFYAAATFLQILEQFYSPDAAESADNRARDRKKILYAKWKATDILNALKEGREPTPGAYDPDEDAPGSEEEAEDEEGKPADKTDDQTNGHEALPPAAPFVPPAAPTTRIVPAPVPPPPPYVPPSDDEEMAPPPAYPASDDDKDEPMTFSVPPPEDPVPPPKFSPPPRRIPAPVPPSSLFTVSNKGSKSHGNVSKAQLADATELTRFAMAALEDKDVELAAERLQHALKCLGR